MPQEYDIVIADASCFILLDKIDRLSLLQQLFGSVITTDIIVAEFGRSLPQWVHIRKVIDIRQVETLELEIDKGEASAIALAFESEPSLLVLDDAKARKVADKLHLNYTVTLGLMLRAKQQGIIPAIRPLLEKIQQTNFRFSERIFQELLLIAEEQ